eukprot:GHVT01099732.1.p1 GENE.GHVT01099732.1~~GHVT01099732.1.p1  ORF type:complete len:222 (-),score=37.28 GHVT01099732.1:66-731(-)
MRSILHAQGSKRMAQGGGEEFDHRDEDYRDVRAAPFISACPTPTGRGACPSKSPEEEAEAFLAAVDRKLSLDDPGSSLRSRSCPPNNVEEENYLASVEPFPECEITELNDDHHRGPHHDELDEKMFSLNLSDDIEKHPSISDKLTSLMRPTTQPKQYHDQPQGHMYYHAMRTNSGEQQQQQQELQQHPYSAHGQADRDAHYQPLSHLQPTELTHGHDLLVR